MFHRETSFEPWTEEYGVRSLRLFPWRDVVRPPFGAMLTRIGPGRSTSSHNHHEAETFYVVSGSGVVTIGDAEREVSAGDLVYAPPFTDHTTRNTSADKDLLALAVWWEDMELVRRTSPEVREEETGDAATLVTATPPTVNGDLHLGHLSGPYLAADVFARAQRMAGRTVHFLTGADDHQSYVETKSAQLGTTPRSLADRCAQRIESSLSAARVEVDLFFRPHQVPDYHRQVQDLFRKLLDGGAVVLRRAPTLHCGGCDRTLFEAHVHGGCPHCGSASDGSACEACGRPNDCVDLVDPRCHWCGNTPEVLPMERFYFRLGRFEERLRDSLAGVAMSPHLRALCEEMLADGLPDIAVSQRTSWGVPVPVDGFRDQCVYVWLEMAAGYLVATRDLLDRRGDGTWQQLWASEESRVVQFFGIDNGYFHALLFPAVWMAYDPAIRLPEAFVVNELYRLAGKKFSTSREHAIWVGDFLRAEPPDAVRFYLALDRPESRATSFTVAAYRSTVQAELVETVEGWLRDLGRRLVDEAGGKAPVTGAYTPAQRSFLSVVDDLIGRAEAAYRLETFSPPRAARLVVELARTASDFGESQAFLRDVTSRVDERRTALALELMAAATLSMVAAPLMPSFAATLHSALGFRGEAPSWHSEPRFLPGGQVVGGLAELSFGLGTGGPGSGAG